MERRSAKSFSKDEVDPTYSGLLKPGDYKTKQIFKGSQLLFLAYQSTGVIYGDIGTSPLYVFSSTFGANAPSRDNLIGVLSLIIWSLLIYPTFKYCFVVLRADNEGEGGTFSCYSLLSRYARITHRDPKEEPLVIWVRLSPSLPLHDAFVLRTEVTIGNTQASSHSNLLTHLSQLAESNAAAFCGKRS